MCVVCVCERERERECVCVHVVCMNECVCVGVCVRVCVCVCVFVYELTTMRKGRTMKTPPMIPATHRPNDTILEMSRITALATELPP